MPSSVLGIRNFTQLVVHEFCSKLTCSNFFQNALNLPEWNFQHVRTPLRVTLLFSSKSSFTWATLLSVLFINGCPKHLAFSKEVTKFLNLENKLQTCVLPIVWYPITAPNISQVSIAFLTSLMQHLIQTKCSFKSAIF